jgi:hypothetical protein
MMPSGGLEVSNILPATQANIIINNFVWQGKISERNIMVNELFPMFREITKSSRTRHNIHYCILQSFYRMLSIVPTHACGVRASVWKSWKYSSWSNSNRQLHFDNGRKQISHSCSVNFDSNPIVELFC